LIYVVSGCPRSGTSLLMQCLRAGGMDLVYEEDIELEQNVPGYHPNPNGYFEQRTVFEAEKYEGKAVKSITPAVRKLPEGYDYKVAFVVRDPREVAASWESSYGTPVVWEMLDESVWRDIAFLEERPNVDLTVIMHRSLIRKPERTLQALSDWPIDVRMAATAVDLSLYRHRRYSSAAQKGFIESNGEVQHPPRDEGGEAAETSDSDSHGGRREVKEEAKVG